MTIESKIKRIAMWSGPRNISTAMMRAWENRGDAIVVDEPLYGQYLHHTGIEHPGAQEVIEVQGQNWRLGVDQCFVDLPSDKSIHYQKHMTMHLLDHIDREWLTKLAHCFLIRHPADVLSSYAAVREQATLSDIGFIQQAQLYEYVTDELERPSLVIDSKDFLQNPKGILQKLCEALGVSYTDKMLSWPAGERETDGVWATYWYASVNKSEGFMPYKPKDIALSTAEQKIVDEALPYYDRLYRDRII
jgi:hypothetical protein